MKNFKIDVDADGIALVTWDIPGSSMNVLDSQPDRGPRRDRRPKTTADATVKGVVITSGKDALSGGADLTHARTHEHGLCRPC